MKLLLLLLFITTILFSKTYTNCSNQIQQLRNDTTTTLILNKWIVSILKNNHKILIQNLILNPSISIDATCTILSTILKHQHYHYHVLSSSYCPSLIKTILVEKAEHFTRFLCNWYTGTISKSEHNFKIEYDKYYHKDLTCIDICLVANYTSLYKIHLHRYAAYSPSSSLHFYPKSVSFNYLANIGNQFHLIQYEITDNFNLIEVHTFIFRKENEDYKLWYFNINLK